MNPITFLLAFICVLASADDTCANDTACVITCGDNATQCQDSVIDASFASNLTMYCPYLNSCRNMTAICPIGSDTKCGISCTDSFSCESSIIHSQSTQTTLNCISPNMSKSNICTNDININVSPNTKQLTVNCAGNNVTVCDHITVSTNASIAYHDTSVSFKCFGNGIHCNSIDISTPNIGTLVSVNSSGTLSNVSIDASKSNDLSVICSHQCENITLFVPVSESATASLLCSGEACQNFTFYTTNNMDDIHVSLTQCPCKLAVKSSCIRSGNEWDIYCEDNGAVASAVFVMNKCDGVCCGDIVKDMRVKECYSGGKSNTGYTAAIVGGICGGIVVLAIIGGAMFYFCKKKKLNQAKEPLLSVTEL